MILDNERQREMLLMFIESAAISGKSIDEVYELKQALLKADIKPKESN